MAKVEFEGEQNLYTSRKILGEEVVPGIVGFLMKNGIVKNDRQAKYVLIGIIFVCILISTYLFFFSNQKKNYSEAELKTKAMKDIQMIQ